MKAALVAAALSFVPAGARGGSIVSGRAPASAERPEQRTEADSDEYAAARAALDEGFVEELLELATAAARHRTFAHREIVLELLLRIDPDQPDAREILHFEQQEGEWRRTEDYRPPRDFSHRALADRERALDRARAGYAHRAAALVLEHGRALGDEWVRAELRLLRELAPGSEAVGTLLGEVFRDGRWVLEETASAWARRPFLEEAAARALRGAPAPEPCDVDRSEERVSLDWRTARCTARVRVLGTVSEEEALRAARGAHAAGDLFETVLGERAPYRPSFTLYLLLGPAQGRLLVSEWPGLRSETQEFLLSLGGGWVTENRAADWSEAHERRVDGAVRQTLAMLLRDTFQITEQQGWAWEGVGLLLGHRLVGTRLTWFVEQHDYRPTTATRVVVRGLREPDARWLDLAWQVVSEGNEPRLHLLLGRGINTMGPVDLLFAYAVSAYLLEGRPHAVPRILERIGARDHPVQVFEEHLELGFPELEQRFHRWLGERTGHFEGNDAVTVLRRELDGREPDGG